MEVYHVTHEYMEDGLGRSQCLEVHGVKELRGTVAAILAQGDKVPYIEKRFNDGTTKRVTVSRKGQVSICPGR